MICKKIAVITGGNSGIGLTVCERLLTLHNDLELCLLCRNVQRAEAAKAALSLAHPKSTINIVIMDTSDLQSVFKASKDLKKRYKKINYLYLNAGIMPVTGVNWTNVIQGILSTNCAHVMSTGEGCLYHTDTVTKDGLKNIFASNVFGHYTLIRELEEHLGGDNYAQIVWTSSRAATLSSFDINDIQHKNGENPYASSKCVIDTVSVCLNKRLNQKNVYSHTTCPGLVMTNLTDGILPAWLWKIIIPILLFLRIFCPSINISSYNGTEAMAGFYIFTPHHHLTRVCWGANVAQRMSGIKTHNRPKVWLSTKNPCKLDPRVKYASNSSPMGKPYIKNIKLNIDQQTEEAVIKEVEDLYQSFKEVYS